MAKEKKIYTKKQAENLYEIRLHRNRKGQGERRRQKEDQGRIKARKRSGRGKPPPDKEGGFINDQRKIPLRYHKEINTKNGLVIVDACEMYEGKFEIMAMYKGGGELDSETANTLPGAIGIFRAMVKRYTPAKPTTPAPLSGKYAKLRDDLKAALEVGKAVEAENPEDGGTCNFDAPALKLTRWNSEKVKQAAKEAGTSVMVWELWGNKRFVFFPNSNAQVDARSRNAEAMEYYLRRVCRYDCTLYCQAD